jgi:hypothetical protein
MRSAVLLYISFVHSQKRVREKYSVVFKLSAHEVIVCCCCCCCSYLLMLAWYDVVQCGGAPSSIHPIDRIRGYLLLLNCAQERVSERVKERE